MMVRVRCNALEEVLGEARSLLHLSRRRRLRRCRGGILGLCGNLLPYSTSCMSALSLFSLIVLVLTSSLTHSQVVLSFCCSLKVFRPLLKINAEFSAEEFETALLNPNDTLSDIHIPLLKVRAFPIHFLSSLLLF